MSQPEYVINLTMCECGHVAVEHYDSYKFCVWEECDCKKFEAVGPEKIIPLDQLPAQE